MGSMYTSKLSIFNTFKTKKDQLTGEALRQRSIIAQLATSSNSALRTRTALSQKIAQEHGISWKNMYSGIFRDMDEVLIPLGLVKEAGRLPLNRGPKVLQEQGIPLYDLTQEGLIVALSLNEIIGREEILKQFFLKSSFRDKELQNILQNLAETVPRFVYSLFEKYVKAYCNGSLEKILPLSISSLKKISDENLIVQREFLEAFLDFSDQQRQKTKEFLKNIS